MAAKTHEIHLRTDYFYEVTITMTIQVHSSSQWGIPQVYTEGFFPGAV